MTISFLQLAQINWGLVKGKGTIKTKDGIHNNGFSYTNSNIMDGFDDDFSPLQGSQVPSSTSIEHNIPSSIDILNDDGADGKNGEDVPALRCKI